jgi:hypothetical protein
VVFGACRDGPPIPIDRHLSLRREGWDVFEVFESKWHNHHAELAVEVALQAQRPA